MIGATGEPSGYYPMDSNGLAVRSAYDSALCVPRDCACIWNSVPLAGI
ncbi:MAG: hypothetical protein KatS3mg017_0925 [Fimbriimonadales bacterium]|nr:MAG: hypothetical protein KatS3mg017_0925 [Fimbriimonadales bacterium]